MMPVLKKAREGGATGGQDRRGRRQGARRLRRHRRPRPRRQRLRLRAVGGEVRPLAREAGALRRRLRVGRRAREKVASGRQGHHPARPRREGDRRAARAGGARRLPGREVRQARGGRAGQGDREGEEDGALPREPRAHEGGRRRAPRARGEGGPRDGRAGEERRGAWRGGRRARRRDGRALPRRDREGGRTAEETVGTCRNLRGIEEPLRAVKGDLSARPACVSTDSHIRAHFLICYVALLVVRLTRADMGWRHSAASGRAT